MSRIDCKQYYHTQKKKKKKKKKKTGTYEMDEGPRRGFSLKG
jgi:hypothetical protein